MRRPNRDEIAKVLVAALDRALAVQAPAVEGYVRRAVGQSSSRTTEDIVHSLEKQYLLAVAALGGVSGVTAAVPGAGTAVALPVNLLEIGGFLDLTALFVLAVADVHGIETLDMDRRRVLVLAVLLGDSGTKVVQKVAERSGPHWARQLVSVIPQQSVRSVNKVLGHNFVTKYGTKQGVLVLGRELPLGLGAAIGASGNLGLGYLSVRAARTAFGPEQGELDGVSSPSA